MNNRIKRVGIRSRTSSKTFVDNLGDVQSFVVPNTGIPLVCPYWYVLLIGTWTTSATLIRTAPSKNTLQKKSD